MNAYRVSWKEANPSGVTIRIYGVTTCPLDVHAAMGAQGPCFTSKTVIPAADLNLAASRPASTGVYRWSAPSGAGDPMYDPTGHIQYYGILISAVNQVGRSAYVLVTARKYCAGCTA